MKKLLVCAGIGLALIAPPPVQADDSADLARMRKEIDELKASYEARIRGLETRLEQMQARLAATHAAAPPRQGTPTAPPPQATPSAPPSQAAVRPATRDNALNPAISLILSGLYTSTSQDPANYRITGFPLPEGAEIGPGERGLSLAESELGISGSIDPYLRGALRVALAPDNSVAVEEAFIQSTSLPHGLSIKAGRFLSGIGYLNEQHRHYWDFVDSPLAYQAFLGSQFADDGVQLRWVAPTDTFLEIGAEIGGGRAYPGTGSRGNGAGSVALHAHAGGDIGESSSWRAGLSLLQTSPDNAVTMSPDPSGEPVSSAFTGRNRVWMADAVWKWAPDGNPAKRNFKLQGEYLRRLQSGELVYAIDGPAVPGSFDSTQSGWYLQGVYQFVPGWRIGLRAERLRTSSESFGGNAITADATGYRPSRDSVMIDYSLSEFARLRLQFSRDRARQDAVDNQIYLQYQTSLGAHGAHRF